MKIHSTAIISPEAILGEDVEIGPYTIIEGEVEVGARCVIQAHAVLTGRTILGEENFIGYGAILGAAPQDFSFKLGTASELRIGNRNTLREYVTIHRGTKEGTATRVGDNNFLMNGVHLGHNALLGNRTVIANNVLLAGYVEVEDAAVLGGGTVFHQNIRVGKDAMVRGGTRFTKNIPPYTIADATNTVVGINSIGLKRAGLSSDARLEIKRAFHLLYCSGLNVTQALKAARQQEWGAAGCHFFDFVEAATERGICGRLRSRKKNLDDPNAGE